MSVTVSVKHGHLIVKIAGSCNIHPAVVVEIRRHHPLRRGGDAGEAAGRRIEGQVAVAQQHRHVVRLVVGHDEIRLRVAVEIGHGYRDRHALGREAIGRQGNLRLRLEHAPGNALEHAHTAALAGGAGGAIRRRQSCLSPPGRSFHLHPDLLSARPVRLDIDTDSNRLRQEKVFRCLCCARCSPCRRSRSQPLHPASCHHRSRRRRFPWDHRQRRSKSRPRRPVALIQQDGYRSRALVLPSSSDVTMSSLPSWLMSPNATANGATPPLSFSVGNGAPESRNPPVPSPQSTDTLSPIVVRNH